MIQPIRSHFPILTSNPNLVYLDSASTSQKPIQVIEGVSEYLKTSYANIHRGAYGLSEQSETLYYASKKKFADLIGAESQHEIVYTGNATSSYNLLAQTLAVSKFLQKGDRVVLSIVEHHANIVPWLMLKEQIGIEVVFAPLKADYSLDIEAFKKLLTQNTKIVSLTGASNVTGGMFNWSVISSLVRSTVPAAMIIMDASQLISHKQIDVRALDLDFLVCTGHKMWADTGIGVLYGKKSHLKSLTPSIGGGGAINFVHTDSYEVAGLPFRFEPGTPNMTGAVSLLAALEFFESIGGYQTIEKQEQEIVEFACEQFVRRSKKIQLIGSENSAHRFGVFSFAVEGFHGNDIADMLAEKNICVRAGHHCTEPFHESIGLTGTVRVSFSAYTTKEDLERFFAELDSIIDA